MLISKLKKALSSSFAAAFNKDTPSFSVFFSRDLKNGHFASNIALVAAKDIGQKPEIIAKKLISLLEKEDLKTKKISFQQGYINFVFFPIVINEIIRDILEKGENFGKKNLKKQKKTNYEWISANPTGNLHIGHLRNAVLGDCVSRILEFRGYDLSREFYINDAGRQIDNAARTLFAVYLTELGKPTPEFEELYPFKDFKEPAQKLISEHGSNLAEKEWDESTKGPLQKLFRDFVIDFFIEIFRQNCFDIGIDFDLWFSEASLYQGDFFKDFNRRLKEKNLVYEKDGAVWFRAIGEHIDRDLVLIKRTGEATYFFGDLMYHDNKFSRGFDLIFDLWGSDHQDHYFRIKAALFALGHPAENYEVDFMQMVSLLESGKKLKMSKRAGTVVLWRDFVATVGKDFARFMMISRQKNKSFSLDLALAKEKSVNNPVFYVQYAHARASQILKKRSEQRENFKQLEQLGETNSEAELIFALHRFDWVLEGATKKREPQLIVDYLIDLSKKFHAFYHQNRVLESSANTIEARLQLIAAVRQTLRIGFKLIGIGSPDKM